jgi:hypothetical protein
MTSLVDTIGMGVGGLSALVTASDHIIGNALREPFVKNEIFSDKKIIQLLFFDLTGIIDDTPRSECLRYSTLK